MRFHPIEIVLSVLLVLGLALHVAVGSDYSRRNFEFMPNMVENPGFEAQDPNPNFADGRTLRAPVAGTIPRGLPPLMQDGVPLDTVTTDFAKLTPEQQAAWNAYRPPTPRHAEDEAAATRALRRGKELFESVCATCHAKHGRGGAPVTKRGVPPPPSLVDAKMKELSDGRMFRVITVGQGNMAAHANQVPRDERWLVIRYLRTLQDTKH